MEEPSLNSTAEPDPSNGGERPQDALREGMARVAEVREYVSYLVDAKLDSLKVTGRTVALYAAAGILGLVAGAAFAATAAVLFLVGAADGVGEALHHIWLGRIIVAGGVLLLVATGLLFGLRILPRIMRKQLVSKYEARQRKQRSEFGHDVHERAQSRGDRTGN